MTNDAPLPDDASPTEPSGDVPSRFSVDFTGLTLLGIYDVEEKLAEGGMGSIYSGRDQNLGMRVVIKVPHVKFLSEPGFRQRFGREIKELVRLAHPHIARILAQGEHEEVPFFVLQYLGGGSLEERMEGAEGPPSAEAFVPWMRTMATTLDFVHARGTIHRDVKPANILFDEDDHVFLSDFGVAKVLEGDDANLTDIGTGIGSPKYMAPEQGFGDELTHAADQYGLASMLYECLAGRPPFTEKTPVEILVKKSSEPPDALGELVPDLPPAAANVVMKALSKRPEDRYASCSAFMDAFEATLAPVAEAPVAPIIRARKAPILIGALALLAILGSLLMRVGGEEVPLGDAATNSIGESNVKLIAAGAEPLRPLRYRLKDAPAEIITLDYDQKVTINIGGPVGDRGTPPKKGPPGFQMPKMAPIVRADRPVSLTIHCESDATTAEREFTLRWKVTELTIGEGGIAMGTEAVAPVPLSKAQIAGLKVEEDAYRALAGETTHTPNGVPRAYALTGDLKMPQGNRQQLEVVAWTLGTMPTPFPVEPIGVGAIWEVTEVVISTGMRLRHTKRYELISVDGNRVEVKASVTEIANEQEVDVLQTGEQNMSVKLLALTGRGRSTAILHLDHATPEAHSFRMRLEMEVEYSDLPFGPKGAVMAGTMDVEVTMGIKRR